MGATTAVGIEEYLASSYEPDMDFVDGVLEDRNVGEFDHGDLQGQVIYLLKQAGFRFTVPELRLRVSATRCRVPDVCVYLEKPTQAVPAAPPALTVEVLSPDDRMSRVMARLKDYIAMGCPCVWLLDPQLKEAYIYDGVTSRRVDELTHPSIPALRLALSEIGF